MTRNKTISDEAVLDALLSLILTIGPDNLTFAKAAGACGLAPATLVQRYGDRQGLVRSILLRSWDRLDADTAAADAELPVTVAGAVDLLMRLMPPELADQNASDGLLLLREDVRDPVLRARGARWARQIVEALGRRLSAEPQEAERLGSQLACVWQGAHTWWAFTQAEPFEVAMRRVLEDWCRSVIPMRLAN
ncbi:TetR/AcrR family transcriptional regulator [Shinella sp.]|uniref:TetR/AcrR family transcriptional regulator n=1 Tax=Shinella sp. TaxID=1870904 RepID=UPI003F6F7EAF